MTPGTASSTSATTAQPEPQVVPTTSSSFQSLVAAITVTLAKDFLLDYNIQENSLYLGMMGCQINGGNSTHVQLTVAWNECAIQLIHVRPSFPSQAQLYLVGCLVPRYDAVEDVFSRVGALPVLLQLMNSSARLPLNHRLSSQQDLVLEVSINTTSEQIKLIINKCWATSTQDPEVKSHLYLLSCALNSYTQVLMNGNSTTSRVAVRIFSFVNLTVVYLHCQVQLCIEMGSNTCTAVSTSCFGNDALTSLSLLPPVLPPFSLSIDVHTTIGNVCSSGHFQRKSV
uniref:ZP domain-containing protein n=1 Tax=Oryzias latipes TaxID=8090 RepID=A0A3P9JSZ6_ORYLA